jgi:hypothetical protein
VTYVGSRARSLPPTVSTMQARKLIVRGGQAFLAFVWCGSIQMSFRQTTLDYHHRERWSLGLSVCQALILSLRHHIGWHRQS